MNGGDSELAEMQAWVAQATTTEVAELLAAFDAALAAVCACGEPATEHLYDDDAPPHLRGDMVCDSCFSHSQDARPT